MAISLSLLVPFMMTALAIRHTGPIQQGRYFLALAVSVPIVSGAVIRPNRLSASGIWVAAAVPLLAATAEIAAGYWALQTYTTGTTWAVSLIEKVRVEWHPPLPAWTLDIGFLTVWAIVAALTVQYVRRTGRPVEWVGPVRTGDRKQERGSVDLFGDEDRPLEHMSRLLPTDSDAEP